jgi:hypothetical protein
MTKVPVSAVSMSDSRKWPVHCIHKKGGWTSIKIIADFYNDDAAADIVSQIQRFRQVVGDKIANVKQVTLITAHKTLPEAYIAIEQEWGMPVEPHYNECLYSEYTSFLLSCVMDCLRAQIMYSDPKMANTTRSGKTGKLQLIDIDSEGAKYGAPLSEVTNNELVILAAERDPDFLALWGTPRQNMKKSRKIEWMFRRIENTPDSQALVFVCTINKAPKYGCNMTECVESTEEALERVHNLALLDGTTVRAMQLCCIVARDYKRIIADREHARMKRGNEDIHTDTTDTKRRKCIE